MLKAQIPKKIRIACEKATAIREQEEIEWKKGKRKILNRAIKMLSFLQEIGREPVVSDYLQTGRDLMLLVIGGCGPFWIALHWEGSPKVVLKTKGLTEDTSFYNEIISDSLDEWIENRDSTEKGAVYTLAGATKEKIWNRIQQQLSKVLEVSQRLENFRRSLVSLNS